MLKKLLIIIAFLLVIILLTSKLYFHVDLPIYSGIVSIAGLEKPVDVYTDEWGVPHIYAENERDLFFTAGYIAARERLWQMTLVRAAARGELSSLFGRDMLSSDIYLRTWQIPEMGRKGQALLSPETLELVQRFCDGINGWIEESDDNLPVEFRILGIKPLTWEPSDVIGYARLMAHDLQQSWKPEILFGEILNVYGPDKLSEILPEYGEDRPTIANESMSRGMFPVFAAINNEESKIRNITGMNGHGIGSNSWVISGAKTTSGKPILANDPHLGFTQPAKWYEMHLVGGSFNVSGVCLAGLPVPVLGQNPAIAWGFTNIMADDIDFFIETVNPEDPTIYRSGEEWLPFTLIEETISIRGEPDTTVTVRLSKHGPVISDIHPMADPDHVLTMQWTGHENFQILESLFDLSRAYDWSTFSHAVEKFGVPGQNICYADTSGNIGWRPAVKIPIRKNAENPVPRPGSNKDYDWQGYVPFDEMPYLYNPSSGYIATANNKTIGDEFPHYISNFWLHPSRVERIIERLEEEVHIDVHEVKDIQNDIVSVFARTLSPWISELATHIPVDEHNALTAKRMLEHWDGTESVGSPAALVFHFTITNLIKNMYADELNLVHPEAFDAFINLVMVPHRTLELDLLSGASSWIDNIETPDYIETLEDIVSQSILDAVRDIEFDVGPDPDTWKWGEVHTLTHPHSLGDIDLLNRLFSFNVGPFPTGGSDNSVNNGGYSLERPYKEDFGASMRRIVDLSNLNETQFVIPTGQSGHPRSPHYDDQAPLFISGKYRTTRFNDETIKSSDRFRHLSIIPHD